MALRLSKENLRAACAKLRAFLAAGDTDAEACKKLGCSWTDYEELRSKLLEIEVERVKGREPEQVYVEYCLQQESNVQALSDMIADFKTSKQHGAMVGAVKARAEIYDKMIEKGQEFGLIEKVPQRTEIVAGVMVKELTNQDLRAHITSAVANLDDMLRKYGTAESIVDIIPGQLHFPDPPKPKALEAGAEILAVPETDTSDQENLGA